MMPKNALYIGTVFHKRHQPFEHAFRYNVFTLFFDLDGLPQNKWRFLSYNRFNLLSIADRDHGARDGTPIKTWALAALATKNIALEDGKIFMLTFPRILGWAFTPLTVYFCHTHTGALAAIIYQVKNTFGEQHSYVLPITPENQKPAGFIEQACDKIFYVSPFIQMACRYQFRLRLPDENLTLAIHQFQDNGKILTATWDGSAQPLTDSALLRAALTTPLQWVKIITGIHWEALKLWIKGAPYFRHTAPPKQPIS